MILSMSPHRAVAVVFANSGKLAKKKKKKVNPVKKKDKINNR